MRWRWPRCLPPGDAACDPRPASMWTRDAGTPLMGAASASRDDVVRVPRRSLVDPRPFRPSRSRILVAGALAERADASPRRVSTLDRRELRDQLVADGRSRSSTGAVARPGGSPIAAEQRGRTVVDEPASRASGVARSSSRPAVAERPATPRVRDPGRRDPDPLRLVAAARRARRREVRRVGLDEEPVRGRRRATSAVASSPPGTRARRTLIAAPSSSIASA